MISCSTSVAPMRSGAQHVFPIVTSSSQSRTDCPNCFHVFPQAPVVDHALTFSTFPTRAFVMTAYFPLTLTFLTHSYASSPNTLSSSPMHARIVHRNNHARSLERVAAHSATLPTTRHTPNSYVLPIVALRSSCLPTCHTTFHFVNSVFS